MRGKKPRLAATIGDEGNGAHGGEESSEEGEIHIEEQRADGQEAKTGQKRIGNLIYHALTDDEDNANQHERRGKG